MTRAVEKLYYTYYETAGKHEKYRRNLLDQLFLPFFWLGYNVVHKNARLSGLHRAVRNAHIFTEILLIHFSLELETLAVFHEY